MLSALANTGMLPTPTQRFPSHTDPPVPPCCEGASEPECMGEEGGGAGGVPGIQAELFVPLIRGTQCILGVQSRTLQGPEFKVGSDTVSNSR